VAFEHFMVGFGWLAAVLFIAVSSYKIARLARLPLNVRWEVYPVPHEAKEKRRYGGSYMEEIDWATKRRTASPLAAYMEIAAEVLTLKRVREHNGYGIWPLSLAMHWGLYLYFGWLFLLAAGNVLNGTALSSLTVGVGLAAHILGAAGAVGLVVKRATNRDLQPYTTRLDYFNLLFLAAFFIAGLVSWLGDSSFAAHRAYIGSVLFLRPARVPAAVSVSFLLFELFLIYMPFTKLIHYFAKYFTFDRALWDDDFKAKGSAVDRQVTTQLGYAATWSAPHIAGASPAGTPLPGSASASPARTVSPAARTWLEQAQTTALPEGKK
jgi:nitrate reductase gamma subunit